MKRQLSKSLVDQAKLDLREEIIKRIVKDANYKGCWNLKSVNGSKIVDAVCHFRDRGTKKIFFKARRGNFRKRIIKYVKDLKYPVRP